MIQDGLDLQEIQDGLEALEKLEKQDQLVGRVLLDQEVFREKNIN